MSPIPLAIVGVGKIARDAHIPALAKSGQFELAAVVSRHGPAGGAPAFATISDMAAAMPQVRAVSICTPPIGRLELVKEALSHGLDVMIEKPPAATISEAERFAAMAHASGRTLYATWHSREAAGVRPAREWLRHRSVQRVAVAWKEDVRVWHPGQEWIWEPGVGIFDPGVNALSVLTAILPGALLLRRSELRFPENRAAPIAASLAYSLEGGAAVEVELDFDQRGPQTWDIEVQTDDARLTLTLGGSKLSIDGEAISVDEQPEYDGLYRRFAELLERGESDVDLSPFRHVADAFLLARRVTVGPFSWSG